MAKRNTSALNDEVAEAMEAALKAKKPRSNGKAVTKMKILPTEEPLSEFQTGEALSEREDITEPFSFPTLPQEQAGTAPLTLQSKGVKINNVKLIKDLFLKINFDKSNADGMSNIEMKNEAPIHDDLRNALTKLNKHLAALAGQYNNNGQLDIEGVQCVGFTVRTGNVYGVKLIGIRKLEGGKQINVLPPFTRLSDGTYVDAAELEQYIDEITNEVKQYLDGKHKPSAQATFDFGGENVTVHTSTVYPPADSLEEHPYADEAL